MNVPVVVLLQHVIVGWLFGSLVKSAELQQASRYKASSNTLFLLKKY